MGRRSKIETMVPEPIKERINALYRAGRTIDQIMSALAPLLESGELPEAVSRSGVGRYLKSESKLFDQMKASEEFAAKVLTGYGEAAKGDVGKLAALTLQQLSYEAAHKISDQLDDSKTPDAAVKNLMMLSAAVRNAKQVERDSNKQREEHRREERVVREEAAQNARKAAQDIGLTDAQAKAIIDKILLGSA